MSLILSLAPDLEAEIRRAAKAEGMPVESYAMSVLKERVRERPAASEGARILKELSDGLPRRPGRSTMTSSRSAATRLSRTLTIRSCCGSLRKSNSGACAAWSCSSLSPASADYQSRA
jgi:hypothetical protein